MTRTKDLMWNRADGYLKGLLEARVSVVAQLSDSEERDDLVSALDEKIAQAERDLAAWS